MSILNPRSYMHKNFISKQVWVEVCRISFLKFVFHVKKKYTLIFNTVPNKFSICKCKKKTCFEKTEEGSSLSFLMQRPRLRFTN